MNYPALLSFICGFASLSLEILWVRLYSFSMLSLPAAFGFVLMSYLIGIAIGAHFGGKACKKSINHYTLWHKSSIALFSSGLFSLILPHLFSFSIKYVPGSAVLDFLFISLSSATLAYIFPISHHLGAGPRTADQGRRFASVYSSNVLGAALGPLATGYILLDALTLQQSFLVISALQLSAAIVIAISIKTKNKKKSFIFFGLLCTTITFSWSFTINPHALLQRVDQNGLATNKIIENRSGVISISHEEGGDDTIYGGNVYDGKTNLSPENNTNGLHRPLLLAALHPEPKRVLIIGLSIGSWLALINNFPGVDHIDSIEINKGYLSAITSYPDQNAALQDPRVNIIINDARRWLRQNPEKKYDLIIMNNTWHWRSNSSLLLSQEFMKLLQTHMNNGAVMAFNSTDSADAFFTAHSVFNHSYKYGNFVYSADFDFRHRKDEEAARIKYAELQLNSRPLFRKKSPSIDHFLSIPFITLETVQKQINRPLEIITDSNMITEFKYGNSLY